jgi:hypothetical protein
LKTNDEKFKRVTTILKTYQIAKQKTVMALSWACMVFAFAPFIVAGLSLLLYNDIGIGKEPISNIILVIWLCGWAAASFAERRLATNARLMVSEIDLSCDNDVLLGGFSTRWENILGIQVTKYSLSLFLKEPSIPRTKWGAWAIKRSLIRPDVIDLSNFIDHWNTGELKQDFEKYAPHLFPAK